MRKTAIILFVLTTIIVLSCGQQKKGEKTPFIDRTLISLPGDSALYGLACEGSSDTLLILLTNVNANPDTFNMLEAVINRQIFGRPTAGDKLAVLLSPDIRAESHQHGTAQGHLVLHGNPHPAPQGWRQRRETTAHP
jgi:hypothetical protein